MVGLADCNNFFVSCERSIDASLNNRAVVVLSNNDGCAIARSNEAKRMGIRMGQPAFELRDLINSGKLIALSGNHLLYREISIRIHNIFRRYAPDTIDYSIDEAFLNMSGIPDDALSEIGEAIYNTCLAEERIPVTLGFAATKTLAKIATETGKKNGKHVVTLNSQTEIDKILSEMPINDLWGIGRRLSKKLYTLGVYTISDFANRPLLWVRSNLGVNGEKSWRELHGEPCIELDHVNRSRQDSVSESRTFPKDINDYDYIRSRIANYCAGVSKRLRDMDAQTALLTVFLTTNRFHTEHGYFSPEISVRFEPPVNDVSIITSAATAALEKIFNPTLAYKRAGVVLSQITPTDNNPSLFDLDEEIEAKQQSKSLMNTIDRLNQVVGFDKVKLAAQISKGNIGHNDGYSSSFGAPK